jgi:hypothetical protein
MATIEERTMAYHVARTNAKPGEIWGHRFTNLRDAMVAAEELTADKKEDHTVWRLEPLWTAHVKEPV